MRLKYILLALWTKGAVAGCIVVSGSEVLAGDLAHWFPELSGVASGRAYRTRAYRSVCRISAGLLSLTERWTFP
jgi:hypothetical protein